MSKRGIWVAAVAAGLPMLVVPAVHAATTDTTPAGCDWPMYQHDALHSGASCAATTVSNATALTLIPHWFMSTGQNAVTASPIVAAGHVFVGDSSGLFYAIDATSGATVGNHSWTLDTTKVADTNTGATDTHAVSYGQITATAAYFNGNVYFGAGGSVLSVNATTGAVNWATNMDPNNPTSPVEVESSPLIYQRSNGDDLVIVGDDVNEATRNDQTGLNALDLKTGQLVWQFQPETRQTVTTFDSSKKSQACGDVWGSPAYYDSGSPSTSLFVFGTGNCNTPGTPTPEAIWAVNAEGGAFRSVFVPPPNQYGYDDDFGSSVIITKVQNHAAAIALNKSGYGYALQLDGSTPLAPDLWGPQGSQIAQPGQTGPGFAGAIGGFIGSAALGESTPVGSSTPIPTLFAASAIPTPTQGSGLCDIGGDPSSCITQQQLNDLVDSSLTNDPLRLASLHAVKLDTGAVIWHQLLELPTYAAVSYSNGAVFAPSTTGFSDQAFDASTGAPLWGVPLAASASSGTAIAGDSIFFGAGTAENSSLGLPSQPALPPQAFGVWSFQVPVQVPSVPSAP